MRPKSKPKTPEQVRAELQAELDDRLDEAAIRSFAWFVRRVFPVLHPGAELVWGPHLDAICRYIQKQIEGDPEYQNVLIMIPPGFMKSMLVSAMRPAWLWLHHPHRQSLYTSNSKPLATRDSRRTRDIIESEVYQRILARVSHPKRTGLCEVCRRPYPHPHWKLADDQNEKDNFATTRQGFREIIVMNGKKTGRRGDDLVVDDAVDADELKKASAESARMLLEDAAGTVKYIFGSRFNNSRTVSRLYVAQRLHKDDPPGVLLRDGTWPWKVLRLSQTYEPEDTDPEDWRTVRGELLCPAFFPAEAVTMAKSALGLSGYMAQHEQRPTDEDAAIVKRAWFSQRYTESPVVMATQMDEVAISVDCTFKGGESNDRVSIQVWGRRGRSAFYLLDRVCAHLGFLATVDAIRAVRERWPAARLVLVEDKANGPAVMEVLRREFAGVVGFNPNGSSKPERVKVGVVPALQSGSVWVPAGLPWADEYVEEMVGFTGKDGGRDDDADATSQILLRWTSGSAEASAEVRVNRVEPVLDTEIVTRWCKVDPTTDYVIGVGADWSRSKMSAAVAVVLNRQGEQVARVVGFVGGEDAFARQVAEEAVYWRGPGGIADVVVGSEVAEVGARTAVALSAAGARVRGRPGAYVSDGDKFVWTALTHVSLWGHLLSAIRADKMLVRDENLAAALGEVRAEGNRLVGMDKRRVGSSVVALLCASVGVEIERPVAPVRPRIEFKRQGGERADAWVRAASARRGVQI